jgi:predicted deacylase
LPWSVAAPAAVVKGTKPGKRVALVSGVHGDEISAVHTIQTVINQLDPSNMSGTVMAVPDVSRPALEGMARRWPNSGRGIADYAIDFHTGTTGSRTVQDRRCCRFADTVAG